MPRQAREKSNTGIYHIMIRGINKQKIFLDRNDREKFLSALLKYKKSSGYDVFGYCLMDNHIHLLLKEGQEPIDLTLKRIGVSYVFWFNKKYERSGHLFQDRFKSEPVEDDLYLFVVLRYIHQNPLNAKIVKDISDFEWSSHNSYLNQTGELVDFSFILKIFNPDPPLAVTAYKSFMLMKNRDECLDIDDEENKNISDQQVVKLIKELTGQADPKLVKTMDKKVRNRILKTLKDSGARIRQLAEITEINRGIIERAGKT
ncbi:MAG: transposase [Bacillota bacterium]|nr:transposase [Bacillota bacterium]